MNGVHTEVIWQFGNPDVLQFWHANGEVADIRFEQGAMFFRTTGHDPMLEYLPLLNLPALPHQAVEIEMRASIPGEAELFWSNTSESPYGGFMPGKSTRFAVRGDRQWHTYRVFPFWQKEGRIVRLRFDPYGVGDFALRAIRIVRLEGLPLREGQREFVFRDGDSGWTAWRGIESRRDPGGGVQLQLLEPDGFFATRTGFEAQAFPYLTVRLRSASARQCTIVFATSEVYGIQQYTFDVLADGKPRLYNVDMMGAPAWSGEVVMLGIRPAPFTGDTIVLERLSLAAQPQGKAELHLVHFDIEDAAPRAGAPVMVALRMVNAGGEVARGVRATLKLPQGSRLLQSLQQSPGNLPFGQEGEWRWRVLFSRSWQGTIQAQIRGANIAPMNTTAMVRVMPRLVQVTSRIVPAPSPVKPEYPVGVYYFPGWRSAGQWAPITRFPERKPVLGWYREGNPQVADWHIKWAVEHGITFFVYDWYWVQGARQLEHALHEGYFNSRYRRYLQFCLLWANHNPRGTSSYEDCVNLVRHWLKHYFHRPEYLRIDGKPVVIIFSPHDLRRDIGREGVKRSLDAMREECVRAGLKGLYILACVGGTGDAILAAREGYDAVTAYNWAYLGVVGDTKWASFDTLIDGYRQQWESIVQNVSIPLLPPISGGWDSRPWHGQNALVRYGRTPEKFKKHLQDALQLLQRYPQKVLPMVLIEAWNEWGEGSYIEPHKEFGFGYLDAIREVFTSAPRTHADLTPADIGLPAPQVDIQLVSVPRWEFVRNTLGWDNGMYLHNPRIEKGALTAVTAGDDPAFFGPPVQVPASRYRRIRLRMRLETTDQIFEDTGQVFWTTSSVPESEASSVRFPVSVDGRWRDYMLNVSENLRWRGVVTRLRLDPCTRAGVRVQIALIELLP
ncbi:MAG: glycoside hydrolase family 99-like domain-containing protein [bacterium]|nr:glycoside hydrolase family 99-like domain-containing protein [bacterium]